MGAFLEEFLELGKVVLICEALTFSPDAFYRLTVENVDNVVFCFLQCHVFTWYLKSDRFRLILGSTM
jgi:hypothetical protein